jgi:hypothetical protein
LGIAILACAGIFIYFSPKCHLAVQKITLKFGIFDKLDIVQKTHKGSIVNIGGIGVLARLAGDILMGTYCIGKLIKNRCLYF